MSVMETLEMSQLLCAIVYAVYICLSERSIDTDFCAFKRPSGCNTCILIAILTSLFCPRREDEEVAG
jgi:hypothetical protein